MNDTLRFILQVVGFTVLALVLVNAFWPRADCAVCGAPMPKWFYRKKSVREVLWGGWTCSQCGARLDWRGRRLEQ